MNDIVDLNEKVKCRLCGKWVARRNLEHHNTVCKLSRNQRHMGRRKARRRHRRVSV